MTSVAAIFVVTDGAGARAALKAHVERHPELTDRVVINNGGDFDVADVAFEFRARYVHHTFCADDCPVQWVLRLLIAAESLEAPLVEVHVQGEYPHTFKTAHVCALAERDWERELVGVEAKHALEYLLLVAPAPFYVPKE